MGKKDRIVVELGGKEIEIYPLMELEDNNKRCIVYTTTTEKDRITDEMYIGILDGINILPIDMSKVEYFDKLIQSIMENIPNHVGVD